MTLKHESYTPRLSLMHKTQKPRSSSNVELAYLQTSRVRDLPVKYINLLHAEPWDRPFVFPFVVVRFKAFIY